jgi:hypothetical protein
MRCFWSGLVLASILAAGSAQADVLVYHSASPSGVKPGYAPYLPKASSVTLNLWLDPGPTPPSNTDCVNATGDASCAYDLRVEVRSDPGGPQLLSFTPTWPTVGTCTPADVGCNLTSSMLRTNKILLGSPIVGRTKIGQLTVNTLGKQGAIVVTGVHSVGAGRQLQKINGFPPPELPPQVPAPGVPIAYVPEPGMLILLFSGLAGLAVLHRLRGSR